MTAVVKVKVHGFNESIIVAKPVGVDAHGCEQLAQSRVPTRDLWIASPEHCLKTYFYTQCFY